MSSSKINQSSSNRLLTLEPINIMAFTMILSLVWAVAVIIFGCIVRFFTASLLDGLAEASANVWRDKTLTKNAAGQDICPLLTEVKDMPDVGDWLLVLGSVLLSAGSLTFVYSVLGFFAAVKECKLCIAVEIVLIFITIALMIYVVQIIYNPFFGFHEIAKNQLTTKLIEDYTIESDNSGFTALMNSIMILKECCGIRGAADFRNLTFYEKTFVYPDPYFFNLPPACCKPTFFKGDSDRQIFTKLLACAQRGLSEPRSINLKGCYDEVFKHVQALHGGWMSTIFILMILLSACQIGLAILALLANRAVPQSPAVSSKVHKKDVEVDASHLSPQPTPQPPKYLFEQSSVKVILKKTFRPHSKVSSYPHGDPKRIRSTEIW